MGMGLAIVEPDQRIQQMTYNLFADMGVQAATPAQTLVLDSSAAAHSTFSDQTVMIAEPDPFSLRAIQDGLAMMGVDDAKSQKNTPVQMTHTANVSVASLIFSDWHASTTANGATITWKTNVPATGKIWVMLDPGILNYSARPTGMWQSPQVWNAMSESLTNQHEFTVTGLDSDSVYYFQIAGTDVNEQINVSTTHDFRTSGDSWLNQIKKPFSQSTTKRVARQRSITHRRGVWSASSDWY